MLEKTSSRITLWNIVSLCRKSDFLPIVVNLNFVPSLGTILHKGLQNCNFKESHLSRCFFLLNSRSRRHVVCVRRLLTSLHMFPLIHASDFISTAWNRSKAVASIPGWVKPSETPQRVCRRPPRVFPGCKQSCVHLLPVGRRQPYHNDQLGGWCLLRADYPGRRVLLCACWLGECSLCALIIRRVFLQQSEMTLQCGSHQGLVVSFTGWCR